jgi:CBS domain-containing protein
MHRASASRARNSTDMRAANITFEKQCVSDVMTPGVITCVPSMSLRAVARMMANNRVHAVVVIGRDDERHPWGVISDLDLVTAIGTDGTAGTVAGSPLVTIAPDAGMEDAARLLAEHQTAHLLVTADGGLPIGVISTLDVARAFSGADSSR